MKPPLLSTLLAIGTLIPSASSSPIAPSPAHAHQNAFQIFNAVHSAMRQWGSSLQHNGMSLIPAIIPRGTVLFHGSHHNTTPVAPEWLAFEMEHAENFARSLPARIRPRPPSGAGAGPGEQRPLGAGDGGGEGKERMKGNRTEGVLRGYFHTFIATRDLHLLYIDGSSAGNGEMGTLDTQDYILRLLDPADAPDPWRDIERATEICNIVTSWGYDGVIRMEIGFEVIACDFHPQGGLQELSVVRSKGVKDGTLDLDFFREAVFYWASAAGERYDGIGGGRVKLDFSRMVSALWYPVNLTNPKGGEEGRWLPRLLGTTKGERGAMRRRVEELAGRRDGESLDWQGVADLVVTRYKDWLERMVADGMEDGRFVREVFAATEPFVAYLPEPGDLTLLGRTVEDAGARGRCARQYLLPVEWRRGNWTMEDEKIYLAVERVTRQICDAMFNVRATLEAAEQNLGINLDGKELVEAVRQGRKVAGQLMAELGWTVWKRCRGCASDEVCFVAMWPYGRRKDHYDPGCLKQDVFTSSEFWTDNYWDVPMSPPPAAS